MRARGSWGWSTPGQIITCLNLKNCVLCFVATSAMPGMNVIFYAPSEMFKKKERRPFIGDPSVNLSFLNNKLRTPTKQRRFLQVKLLIPVQGFVITGKAQPFYSWRQ